MDDKQTDDILKSFYRQSEALDFFRSKKRNDLFVFSWEVGLGGQRKFMVTTLKRVFIKGCQSEIIMKLLLTNASSTWIWSSNGQEMSIKMVIL